MTSSRIPSLGSRGEGWFALQIVLILAIVAAAALWPGSVDGGLLVALRIVGAALIVGGLMVILVGIRDLDRSLSPLPKPIESAVLVEHGLYRYVRHPIYSGLIVAALGGSVYTASLAALALTVVLAVVLDLKSRREELWLSERYPGYAAYALRTRRFIPKLY